MAGRTIRVEVIQAWPRRYATARVELPEGATAADALAAARPLIGLETMDVPALAIYGERVEPEQALRDGDRLEVLRALLIDPKDARRRRAGKAAKR